jgi:cation transport ATPase
MMSAVADGRATAGPSATALSLFQLATLGGVALLTWLHLAPFAHPALLPTIAALVGGASIWADAIRDLTRLRVGIALSIAIAVATELALGDFSSAVITTLVLRCIVVFENWATARGVERLARPLDLLPTEVRILADAGVPLIPLGSVRPGDVAVVLGGRRFPGDGIVVNGCSLVDESVLTGQPVPIEKGPGARVLAGTLNQSSALEVKIERIGRHTALRHIVETVDRGCVARAPIERLADRLQRVLTYCGLTAAAATLFATGDPRSAVAVILVMSGGAAVSTRVALLTAVGRSLARGAIVKGGACLEALWACDTAVLVPSASLAFDEPVVRAVYPAAGVSVHDVLTAAAIAERPSNHPIGRAILRSAAKNRLVIREPDRYACVPGCGIRASSDGEEILVGNTAFVTQGRLPDLAGDDVSSTVFVMRGGRYLGGIALATEPRSNATLAIAGLKSLAIRTHLFTSDSRAAAEPRSTAVGRSFRAGPRTDGAAATRAGPDKQATRGDAW